jgi:hypothetical protein
MTGADGKNLPRNKGKSSELNEWLCRLDRMMQLYLCSKSMQGSSHHIIRVQFYRFLVNEFGEGFVDVGT